MQWVSALLLYLFCEEKQKTKENLCTVFFYFFFPDQEVLTAMHIHSSEITELGENNAKILKTG